MINDYGDREIDLIAGKNKFVYHISKPKHLLIVIAVWTLGLLVSIPYWKVKFFLPLLFLNYILAVLYSMPPVRLKNRGTYGLLAASITQRTMPALLCFAIFSHLKYDTFLFALLFTIVGLREEIIHQLKDYRNDVKCGITTAAVSVRPKRIRNLLLYFLVPMELFILVIIIITICLAIPKIVFFIIPYIILKLMSVTYTKERLIHSIIEEQTFLNSFYFVWLPVFLLFLMATYLLYFLIIIPFHILFNKEAFYDEIQALKRRFFGLKTKGEYPPGNIFLKIPIFLLRRFLNYDSLLKLSNRINTPLVTPLSVCVSITNKCNSRCIYCEVWKNKNVKDPTFEQLVAAFHQLQDLGVKVLTITGGEPLLREDLKDIIKTAQSLSFRIQVITNGSLPDRLKEIVETNIDVIAVSIDTLENDMYQKLRQISFDNIKRSLDYIISLPSDVSTIFCVICVITPYNIKDVPSFVKKLADYSKGRLSINLQPVHMPPHTWRSLKMEGDENFLKVEDRDIYNCINKIIELKSEGYPLNNSVTYLKRLPDFIISGKIPDKFSCLAGYAGVSIGPMLSLYPCYLMPSIGTLQHEKLSDLWFSKQMKESRIRMKKRECCGCAFDCHTEESWFDWDRLIFLQNKKVRMCK